jgi:hypothetical protein
MTAALSIVGLPVDSIIGVTKKFLVIVSCLPVVSSINEYSDSIVSPNVTNGLSSPGGLAIFSTITIADGLFVLFEKPLVNQGSVQSQIIYLDL